MSCRTSCCKTVLFVVVVLVLAVVATPAFAAGDPTLCLQGQYNAFVGQSGSCTSTPSNNTLGCTANDVSISQIPQSSIQIISGGENTTNGPTCFQGGNVTFTADFDILTTANAANAGGRDNVGLYLATKQACSSTVTTDCNPSVKFGPGGKVTSTALCGTCSDNIISPAHTISGTSCTVGTAGCILGSDDYHEFDTGVSVGNQPDNCGDTASTDNSPVFGVGNEGVGIEVQNMFCGGQTCTVNGKTGLLLNYCTSWQTPGSAIACRTTPGTWEYPFNPTTGKPEAVPGTSSKCNCSTVCLPITPVSITSTATKSCTTPLTSSASTSCDAGAEGSGLATYTITLTPTATAGDTVIDGICDSVYGTLAGSPAGCAALNSGVTNNTCAAPSTVVGGATPPNSYSCSFTAPSIGENNSVTDTVTFTGHASANTTVTFSKTSNSVTVHSEDAPATATVTKSFINNLGACVNVRYKVDVHNSSAADEDLKLSGLADTSFGDLTSSANTKLLGSDCGVAAGFGTLAGITFTPADTLVAFSSSSPFALNQGGSDYVCHFDAQICSSALDTNGCFTHINSVSATLALDETGSTCENSSGNTVSCGPTETQLPANGLTVQECITPSTPPTPTP